MKNSAKSKSKGAKPSVAVSPQSVSFPDGAPITAVIGEGWAAMGLVGLLAHANQNVLWITGTGARALSPLPTLENGKGVAGWQALLNRLEITAEEPENGHFLREFRNRSFHRPAWFKAPTPEDRRQVRAEYLWAPETRFAPVFETRFEQTLGELEEQIRARIATYSEGETPRVRKLSGLPVSGFRFASTSEAEEGQKPCSVIMGSGDAYACDRIFFADRWSSLIGMEGIPKGNAINRNRDPMGVLQAVFTHSSPMAGASMKESFYSLTHKDPGEEITRSMFGYFMNEGKKSIWTIFIGSEEGEDNHAIAKKLRRMKQTLDRMFVGAEWVPAGKAAFTDTVIEEQVRYEEALVCAGGEEVNEPLTLAKNDRIFFFTDGYGPSAAMAQVVSQLGSELGIEASEFHFGLSSAPAEGASEESPSEEPAAETAEEPASEST